MANCLNCGREIFVGNVDSLGIFVGFCDCAEVPEVDVFVSENMPCCSDVTEVFCDVCGDFGTGPCSCDKNKEVTTEDEEFITVWTEAEVLAGAVSSCVSCRQIGCDGPNENGYCLEIDNPEEDAEFEAYLQTLRKQERVAVDGSEPVAVAPKWVEAVMAAMMIISFFGLVIDIVTGKNNNPKLVAGFYLVCAYLVVTYGAVIIWFLC